MNLLKKLFNFYINASIHVALAVCSFVCVTALYFGLEYNKSLLFFIFYATITGYNFVKYAGVAKLYHKSLTRHLKIIQIFSLFCFLMMCFYLTKLNLQTVLFFSPFGLLTLLYTVPFFSGFKKNLRSIGYLKIIIVALVWAGITVFLPFFDTRASFSGSLYLLGLQRFLFVVVLILPFDIRDVKYDAISLQTIPKKIGVQQTKKVGYVLLILCLFLEFIITSNTNFKQVFLVIFTLLLVLLMRCSEKQSTYYSSFFVESIPVIWWLLLLIT
ncbi:hypothetical protein G1K75_11630 [Tenacibaculum finnmarkense]|uniref:hypothetical protein n=1 Tax=Tenacibaculum finnmarkense TaxID=2781243 RepID=UPI001E473673|nr:hypothetical protein [Tenacibaculum finnmarkense]MCD8455027.1 hypothetical protein [Tenacibaculum finnmarkense genomovar ulcerans]MCG8806299.1 hypothetical protein [Tenacibaculum finnmarkense]MCG8857350.1 hypothetical protein [Tenacibaculum finnmarkense]